MTLIRACDLALGYDGKTVAENINFTVNEGDYLCVIGENGSGKSTLIKTLLGLNKPVSGSLETALDLKKSAICRSRPRFSGIFPQQSAKLLCRALRVNAVTVRFTARHKGQRRFLICAKWE